MDRLRLCLMTFHFITVIAVTAIVALTAYVPGCGHLLSRLTRENGPFETGSVVLLVIISFYGAGYLVSPERRKVPGRSGAVLLGSISLLALVAALEEISWGQHFWGFDSGAFFMRYNRQHETNLHNLIPAELFGFITNAGVYCLFIFIPLFVRFRRPGPFGASASPLRRLVPSFHNIMMCCFASSLQAYFLYETCADTLALWGSFLCSGILIWRKKAYRLFSNIFHLMILCSCSMFFMFSHQIFRYKNMQYEIREFVIAYALLFWILRWTDSGDRSGPQKPGMRDSGS